ncbi:hypothetical protein SAMN05519104_6667 [Rhizobiales bacterium GAS188]|nr:hypothetical protein SAMN05519104_6667 [Rhizobiales bacterium GAS188]
MNYTPEEIRKMTFAEFHACLRGFVKANSSAPESVSDADFTRDLADAFRRGER